MWTPPVVDMQSPEAPKVLAEASRESGFFYLENHGISEEIMDGIFRQSKAFFSLDIEDKMSVKADKNNRGYTPMHEEILDPKNQTKGDTKEGYYVFREIDADSEEATKALAGPNQWPSEELLPGYPRPPDGEHVGGRIPVKGVLKKESTPPKLLVYMSLLKKRIVIDGVSDPGKGVMGTGAHSDYGLITLLATDEVPGLQVMLDGEWLDVTPRKGAFICNLGDLLQRWTNDQLRSTVHRVVNKLGRERYSIPFFFQPNFGTEVVCFPQFCSEENPAKHEAVTGGAYLMGKYLYTHQDFKGNQNKTKPSTSP